MISNNKQKISNNWNYWERKDGESVAVNLPHTNHVVPYNYFDEKDYQFISYYDKTLTLDEEDKRYFISFDGVMTAFSLYINGIFAGEYKGGYLPHHIEITKEMRQKKEVEVSVVVDSTEREDIPPFGRVVDYLTFGGIYRDVWLYKLEKTFIKDAYIKYKVLEHDGEKGKVCVTPMVEIESTESGKEMVLSISLDGKRVSHKFMTIEGKQKINIPSFEVDSLDLWSIDNPNLYLCQLQIEAGEVIDKADISLGFREIIINENEMLLNGNKIKVFGLNRHQSYPYIGYAMPKRVQEQDALILKNTLGLNTVRTSHYPQSTYFLDKCDEIGLLVMEEIPGWQFVSAREDWREEVVKNVEGMIRRDYNHPSIFTWGVRINESLDDHELYEKTNRIAREMDDSRPTSGIRCIERSEMLEDIYTMNDFICDPDTENILRKRERCTGLEKEVPYIITEFSGHKYPTKRFDQEQRLVNQALIHGKVQSYAIQKEEYLGAVGWCAFDYSTHYDFGSGDRICYHGVMDSFRIPKFAAAVYASQKKPENGYVLEPLTLWTRGERNGGIVFPIHVFTNCDTIELKMNGKTKAKLTRNFMNTDSEMQYLNYPPFLLNMSNGEWGDCWMEAEFIGYHNGKEVIVKNFAVNPVYCDLLVETESNELLHNEFDAAKITVLAVDQKGNILPYLNESISIQTSGDIEMIGPELVSLIGGCIGFWVRTKQKAEAGIGKVVVKSQSGYEKTVNITLV